MSNEIREFLKNTSTSNNKVNFILYKFYLKPSEVLGSSEENTLNKYYLYGNINSLIVNNEFLKFLQLCLRDEEFTSKLDNVLLKKIRYILFDSKEYIEKYIKDLTSPQFKSFLDGEIPLPNKYRKKYNFLDIYALSDLYNRIGWIYSLNITSKDIKKYNKYLNNELILTVDFKEQIYYERYIKPTEERRNILNRISEDDYEDIDSCFLNLYDGHSRKIFPHIICDNEFISAVEKNLLHKDLPNIIIKNIIDILEVSINFKTMNDCYADFELLYSMLDKKKIESFNHSSALALIDKLSKKKTNPKRKKFKLL